MKKEKIYVLGDIHGDFRPVRELYNRIQEKEQTNLKGSTLIILGDFGGNYFFNYRDENFKEKLKRYDFTYFIVRGNHEERPSICMQNNPDKWHTEIYMGNIVYVENQYPYIKYALDHPAVYNFYYEYNVDMFKMYKTLVIPGAYSVDKFHRLASGMSWFENEQLSEEEMNIGRELLVKEDYFDLILSHTCPIIFEPTDLFLSVVDQSMVDKSMERYLGTIEFNAEYRAWMWGHYHAFRDYPRTDGRRKLMLYNNYAIDLYEYIEKDEVNKI